MPTVKERLRRARVRLAGLLCSTSFLRCDHAQQPWLAYAVPRRSAFLCRPRLLFACWHRMDFVIKRPGIADVKHTGPVPTAERVRYLGRETDVGGATQRGGGSISGDIGKVPLDPDIEFLTSMTMVGKGVVGRQVDEQLAPTFGQIAMEGGDLRPWGNALSFKGFPHNALQVNNRLPWSKGERLLVGGQDIGGEPVGH